jgi:predicted amidophosphoribosyltransferase
MLTKIDELVLPDHFYLGESDECYFIGEYTARKGFNFSKTNQLIYNLKKKPDRRHLAEWAYKERAIVAATKNLRDSLNPEFLQIATFVPVPPSKAKGDAMYDDRMTRILNGLGGGTDVRELVIQSVSMEAAHACEDRPSPNDLEANYSIDEGRAEPSPQIIAVVDDVLTTGCHFKAAKQALSTRFPDVRVLGIFLARRVPETDDI